MPHSEKSELNNESGSGFRAFSLFLFLAIFSLSGILSLDMFPDLVTGEVGGRILSQNFDHQIYLTWAIILVLLTDLFIGLHVWYSYQKAMRAQENSVPGLSLGFSFVFFVIILPASAVDVAVKSVVGRILLVISFFGYLIVAHFLGKLPQYIRPKKGRGFWTVFVIVSFIFLLFIAFAFS